LPFDVVRTKDCAGDFQSVSKIEFFFHTRKEIPKYSHMKQNDRRRRQHTAQLVTWLDRPQIPVHEIEKMVQQGGISWTPRVINLFFRANCHWLVIKYYFQQEECQEQVLRCVYLCACQYGQVSVVQWFHTHFWNESKLIIFPAMEKACLYGRVNVLQQLYTDHFVYLLEWADEQKEYYWGLLACERGHVATLQWLLSHFQHVKDILDLRTVWNVIRNECYEMTVFLLTTFYPSMQFQSNELIEIRDLFRSHGVEQQEWFQRYCKEQDLVIEPFHVTGQTNKLVLSTIDHSCMICEEQSQFVTPCHHSYCHSCLLAHRRYSTVCAMCRTPFTDVTENVP